MADVPFIIAVVLTLMSFTIAFKENVLSRIVENLTIGLLGAYATITSVKYLFDTTSSLVATGNYVKLIPYLTIGILLYFQLSKEHRWVSNIPSALLVGTMLGLISTKTLRPQILNQINATVFSFSGSTPLDIFNDIVILITTILSLFYFFFSAGHTGYSGTLKKLSRLALMVAFGASFGNLVMGNLTRLVSRFFFLMGLSPI